ncbi:MAG: PstS family phosphate ABC transporter substrate-binding protein, partial [Planctomycetaceae bacterium]
MKMFNLSRCNVITTLVCLTLAFVASGLSAQEAKPAAKQSLTIEGSTTVGPISDVVKEYFEKQNSGLSVTVKNTGSGNGAAALIDGRCDIATMSRFMKPEEFKKAVEKGVTPVAHVVALDAVCMIVNPENQVLGLSSAQVKDIYAGKIKNWKDVGGADMAIVPIGRDSSSGTFEAFAELVMKKEKLADNVQAASTNKDVHERVSSTKGAIGYVGLGFIDNKVRGLNIDGITPSKKTISSGKYPHSRPLFMFTNGYPAMGSAVH